MKRVVATVVLAAGGAVFGAHAVGCDSDAESHVYVASLYETASDCLEASASLGYIDTPNGDLDCAPTCLVFPPSPTIGGDERIFVSSMCGPYPPNADVSGTDPGCAAALAAWAAGGPGSCESGTTEDGGTGDDGGVDAAPATDTGGPAEDAPGGDDGSGSMDASGGGPMDTNGTRLDASDASDAGAPLDAASE